MWIVRFCDQLLDTANVMAVALGMAALYVMYTYFTVASTRGNDVVPCVEQPQLKSKARHMLQHSFVRCSAAPLRLMCNACQLVVH